jgi:hypothetical protein
MALSIAQAMPLRSAGRGWAAAIAATVLLIETAPVFAQSQPQPPAQSQPAAGQFMPQGQPPVVQSAPQPEAPAPEAPKKPGNVFEAIGQWWDKSQANIKQSIEENNAKWKQSVDEQNAKWRQGVEDNNARWRELNAKNEKAAKDAAAASREAMEALKNLSNIKIVEGRQVCELAANGSPDCQTAAEVFCRSKGFATGKSADITTTRKCKAASLFRRETHECKVETVVIKAACQ